MIRRAGRTGAAILFFAVTLAGAAPSQPAPQRAPSPIITRFAGRPAPAIAASDRAGRPISLAGLRGKVVVVNLWATWCVPCRTEMPSLQRLAAAHRKDLVVIAVSNDEAGWPAVNRFWTGQFPSLRPALAAGPDVAERLGVLGLPYTFIFDRQGREVARVPKATEWDRGEARATIERALAAK